MKTLQVCLTLVFLSWGAPPLRGAQSLADAARAEAERRRALAEQGVEGKVVEMASPEPDAGRPSRSSDSSEGAPPQGDRPPPPASRPKSQGRPGAQAGAGEDAGSGDRPKGALQKHRAELKKLDRAIQKEERALDAKRRRLEAVRRAPPEPIRLGGALSRDKRGESMRRLKEEIADIEANLKGLREDRSEAYDEGRRDGFLPGELE
ncbi:MAG: hypothetical protein LBT74_13220 [Acidobacteriota bacterium]|nr:hypothetical protein [Acidobacteriota bacterium]